MPRNSLSLSKGILEMKFMKRTKQKIVKEEEDAEGRKLYENEISKMNTCGSHFAIELSAANCESLKEGRLSFRGMNPEIERLLELEQAARDAATQRTQPKEVSDDEMATYYHKNVAHKMKSTKFNKNNIAVKRLNPQRSNRAP